MPSSGSPGRTSASSRNSSSAVGLARPLLAAQAGHGDVAVLVVQRGERAQQRRAARPAPRRRTGRCAWRPASVVTSIVAIAMPRSATVSVGTPGRTLPMSPITIASQREQLGMRRRVGVQRAAADLLLALDHDLDPDRRLAVPRAQRADVADHVGLGVRRAAAVERAVALGRLPRRRGPQRLVAGRDDVVVAVEQHGRRARRRRDLADDRGRGPRQLERGDVLHAGVAQQLRDELVGLAEGRVGRLRVTGGGDRRDRRQPDQVLRQRSTRRRRLWAGHKWNPRVRKGDVASLPADEPRPPRSHRRIPAPMRPRPSTARRAGQLIAIATIVVAVLGAVMMRVLDPDEFPTIGSGMWFALQTVTTVGYGDHVPADTEGKVVAGLVMVMGIGFLSVVTASISADLRRVRPQAAQRGRRRQRAPGADRAGARGAQGDARVTRGGRCAVARRDGTVRDMPPNILVIWGDDIGITNLSCYSDGLMGYRTPEHRPHRQRGHALHRLLRRAELHRRARRRSSPARASTAPG